MSAFLEERVLSVHHWTDRLFSFTTTRDPALRFSNGHFTMIGLRLDAEEEFNGADLTIHKITATPEREPSW